MQTHGFAGPWSAGWQPIVDEFMRDFDVIVYDVRGHGRTRTIRKSRTENQEPGAGGIDTEIAALGVVTMPQFAADLNGLMEALGIERAHIGGVSMGGMVSAQFACDFPQRVRSLLLCDTVAGNGEGPDEAANEVERLVVNSFERMAHIVEKYGLQDLVNRENRYRREGDKYAHLSAQSLVDQDAQNQRNKVGHMTQAGYIAVSRAVSTRPDLTSRTPAITAPVLISCGEWDLFYPCAVRDHAVMPDSRFVTIRGAAHDTVNYTPELWLRACTEFIADVEAGREVAGEVVLGD
jgi:pimeloyl-ACP methyl ester carboxylesterase